MTTTTGVTPEFTVPTIRRVSYVLPNVDHPPGYLALPSSLQATQGPAYTRSGPLILPRPNPPGRTETHSSSASSSSHPRHALPVSSLAIDATTAIETQGGNGSQRHPGGILYAGGRDGMVSAWDLGLKVGQGQARRQRHAYASSAFDEEDASEGLLDEELPISPSKSTSQHPPSEKWEMINAERTNVPARDAPSASFRQCIGSHTDWINDILLCNSNQTLVSASSDGNVNIWNPHDADSSLVPQVLGTHKDYAKALAHAPAANWIASGSFDKTIKLWDIKELRHDPIIAFPEAEVRSSVYALSTNQWGSLIAGGSPERIVRVWDPRSGGRQISQLVGHSDAVRKVVLSEDGTHMLTASSDSTVRLWSLGEQRCLHTFTHHADSVWALYSDHPRLDIFYSGDRCGLVCKVDWERCNEVSEGECVVLAKDEPVHEAGRANFRGEASSCGVLDLVSLHNEYVWTASANGTIKCWRDVGSRASREALHPIVASVPSARRTLHREETGSKALSAGIDRGVSPSTKVSFSADATADESLHTKFHAGAEDEQSVASDGFFGIPFDSLVCLAPPNDPYGAAIGLGSISMRLTSRGGVPTPNEANTIFSSASLISIPSMLPKPTEEATDDVEGTQHASPIAVRHAHAHASPHLSLQQSPSSSSHHASLLAHLGKGGLSDVRPASVRSGSLRFAPHDTRHEYTQMDEYDPDAALLSHGKSPDDASEGNHVRRSEEDGDDSALEARLAFEERELAIDAKPLRPTATDVIHCSHGLIRSTLLNDRRHCLTIDSAGLILLWDIVAGRCLGAYAWDDIMQAAKDDGYSQGILPGEALDIVKERIQGHGAAPIWCTVDTKIGSLSIHLEYPRCFDAEIYLDECKEAFRLSSPNFTFQDDQRVNTGRMLCKSLFHGFASREMRLRTGPEAFLAPGKLAMESNVSDLNKLARKDKTMEGVLNTKSSIRSRPLGMKIAIAVGPKSPAIVPIQSPLSPTNTHHLNSMQRMFVQRQDTVATAASADESQGNPNDYFSLPRTPSGQVGSPGLTPRGSKGEGVPGSPTVISPGGSKLMGRLRGLRQKQGLKSPAASSSATSLAISTAAKAKGEGVDRASDVPGGEGVYAGESHQQLSELRQLLAKVGRASVNPTSPTGTSTPSTAADVRAPPDLVPLIGFLPQTALLISESSPDSGGFQVKYRGLVGSTQDDVISLELQSPSWLLEQVLDIGDTRLIGDGAQREKDKLTFLLIPWEEGARVGKTGSTDQLSREPSERLSDSSEVLTDIHAQEKMPPMPTGNSRLTATRMLRIKKACAYVADRLHLIERADDASLAKSGMSSIVVSRRGSMAPGAGTEPNGQTIAASAAQMTNGTVNGASLSKALQQQQLQQKLQLRRPSAISTSTSSTSGAASEGVPSHVMPSDAIPYEYIEILCKEQLLPPSVTLAQVQRYIWKSGAAIELRYRWRADLEREP